MSRKTICWILTFQLDSGAKPESRQKSSQSSSFQRHFITISTGKCQAIGNFVDVSVLFFEDVNQLVCGRTVEITHEFKVKVVTVSMKKDTEI